MGTEIRYVTGDATRPLGEGPRIIAHVCNDSGRWGRGFVAALSHRWVEPERAYRTWYRRRTVVPLCLGEIQTVRVAPDLWVANMVAQQGTRNSTNPVPLRYDALAACLRALAQQAIDRTATVHMPRIGMGLAGGSWDRIEPLITRSLSARGIAVTVYDLPMGRPA